MASFKDNAQRAARAADLAVKLGSPRGTNPKSLIAWGGLLLGTGIAYGLYTRRAAQHPFDSALRPAVVAGSKALAEEMEANSMTSIHQAKQREREERGEEDLEPFAALKDGDHGRVAARGAGAALEPGSANITGAYPLPRAGPAGEAARPHPEAGARAKAEAGAEEKARRTASA